MRRRPRALPHRFAPAPSYPVLPEAFLFSWLTFALLTFGPIGDGFASLCLCRTPTRVLVSHGDAVDSLAPVLQIDERGAPMLSGRRIAEGELRDALEHEKVLFEELLQRSSPIRLDVDAKTPMGTVKRVLSAAAAAGFDRTELVVETVGSW